MLREHAESARRESASYRGSLDPVAVDSGAVVEIDGFAVGSVTFVDEAHVRTVGVLHVLAPYRGVGAGDALLEWLVRDSAERGITSLRAAALPGDRQTKNLFERHGLIARAIQVERMLD